MSCQGALYLYEVLGPGREDLSGQCYVRLVTYFFQKCVVVWNWSPCYDLIHTYRISERDEPRRSLSVVLIDTPLSYRSKTMVTLLNANDAFPRSRTSRL